MEIERQCQKRGNKARDGEGGEGFVETADHDAGVVVPGDGRAAVAECPAEIPGEEREAQNPKDEEGEIGEEVVLGIQGEDEMKDGGCYESDYSRERDSKEEDEGPGNVVFFSAEVMNEEEQNAGDDDGGEHLAQP